MTAIRTHHDTGQRCVCVADHRPPCLELEHHHIWPLYLGGPDTPDNKIWICANTHNNTHELIRLMAKAGRYLSHSECQALQDRPVPRYAHALAARGFIHHTLNLQQTGGEQ